MMIIDAGVYAAEAAVHELAHALVVCSAQVPNSIDR